MDKPIPDWILERLRTTKFDTVYYEYPTVKCEDCDRMVVDRRTVWSRSDNVMCVPHTREKCNSCGFYRNPRTGEFDLTGVQISKIHYKKSRDDK